MKRTSETVYLQSMLHEAHEKAESIREKIKVTRKKKLIPGHDYKHFLPISVLVVAGFFNRPTFVAFAAAPVFFWMQRGVATESYFTPFQTFNFRMVSFLPGMAVTFLLFLTLDSLYYGELTLMKLWHLTMDWTDWKCTPFNFVMYNAVPDNLEKHGAHPRYLHALVNLPLLFGPLGERVQRYISSLVAICGNLAARSLCMPATYTYVYNTCPGLYVAPFAPDTGNAPVAGVAPELHNLNFYLHGTPIRVC